MPCAWRRSVPKAGPCKGPPVSLEFDLESDEACVAPQRYARFGVNKNLRLDLRLTVEVGVRTLRGDTVSGANQSRPRTASASAAMPQALIARAVPLRHLTERGLGTSRAQRGRHA